jgi:hypothetical protein
MPLTLPNSFLQVEDICRRLAESGFPGNLGLSKFVWALGCGGQIAQELIDGERLDHASGASGFDAILIFATAVFAMAAWTGAGKTIFFSNRFFSLETILIQYSYSFSRHDLI